MNENQGPRPRRNDPSAFDRLMDWGNQNIHLLKGGIAAVVGMYLILNKYAIVADIFLFMLGLTLTAYGLSELKVTSLKQMYNSAMSKLFR